MIKDYIKQICEILNIEFPKQESDKSYLIKIDDDLIFKIFDLEDKVYLHSDIDLVPTEKKEEIYSYLMRANLLGQGTGETKIGIDKDEKNLTLSYELSYYSNFNDFKEKVEDFVNYIKYWKEEIIKYKRLIEQGIIK